MSESTYIQNNARRKLIGLGGVVVLHILLFWAIQSGLTRTVLQKMPNVVQAILLEERQPEPPAPTPPAPPPPKPQPAPPITPPPSYVPPAETPVVTAPAAQAIAAVSSTPPPTPAPPAPASPSAAAPSKPSPPVRTAAGVSTGVTCEKPEYPAASRRMEEEGTVSLRFLVAVDGKVIQSEIEKSSGYKRLDEAARAGLSKCQFRPATVDGKPEQAWASIKYTWRLE